MHRFSRMRDRLEMLVPPLPWDRPHWHGGKGPPVILLHGLWRGWHAMQPMARALRIAGFPTLNLPYPSTRRPIPELVEFIRREVEKVADDRPVHFVTHSLGCMLVRALIAGPLAWKPGRIVMLAPPNGGSEIVDWSKSHPVVHRLLGPAGRTLGSNGFPSELPALPDGLEAAVIMGSRSSIPFFKTLLGEENDGIVSVSRGRIPGLSGFSVVDADHTFIQMHPEAIRLTVGFLKTGVWSGR